jgi:hypothetical protein
MKQQINEIRRMQQLAGVIIEGIEELKDINSIVKTAITKIYEEPNKVRETFDRDEEGYYVQFETDVNEHKVKINLNVIYGAPNSVYVDIDYEDVIDEISPEVKKELYDLLDNIPNIFD